MISTYLDLTVRVGCHLDYECEVPTPAVFIVRPRLDENHLTTSERLTLSRGWRCRSSSDIHGNTACRSILQAGLNTLMHDALVSVASAAEAQPIGERAVPVSEVCRRSCDTRCRSRCIGDSDKLLEFAWDHFGQIENGYPRVQAICDWIHTNIQYRYCSGRPDLSASDIIERRYGVCRDFAHCLIALCRTFNLPARYVTGHLPDIGWQDSGTGGDFHAYAEVYLGAEVVGPSMRGSISRASGGIKMSHGLDAVDGAFGTIYGQAQLSYFEVWSYQVGAGQVALGEARDMSKRLDGTPLIRYA